MSYLQRTTADISPFNQAYNDTTNWSYTTRPDTIEYDWATPSGTNGYEFDGKAYVFGFMTATSNSLGQLELVSDSSPRYENGFYVGAVGVVTSRTCSDDEAIGYGSTTEHFRGTFYGTAWASYSSTSRINVIRLE